MYGRAGRRAGGSTPVPCRFLHNRRAGTLTLAVSRDLANGQQDPYYTHTSLMCHEPLIGLDDTLAPTPRLAEGGPGGGRSDWTFRLRQGVTFRTARRSTPMPRSATCSAICRFSPHVAVHGDDRAGRVRTLTDLRKLDASTFQIVHSSPYPLLEATMSNFFSAMFSPSSVRSEW